MVISECRIKYTSSAINKFKMETFIIFWYCMKQLIYSNVSALERIKYINTYSNGIVNFNTIWTGMAGKDSDTSVLEG